MGFIKFHDLGFFFPSGDSWRKGKPMLYMNKSRLLLCDFWENYKGNDFFSMLLPRPLSFLEYTEIPVKWNVKKLCFDCKIRNVLVDSYAT